MTGSPTIRSIKSLIAGNMHTLVSVFCVQSLLPKDTLSRTYLIAMFMLQDKPYTIYVTEHWAELTQAELTQGRVDSGADLTSGRVDPLPS